MADHFMRRAIIGACVLLALTGCSEERASTPRDPPATEPPQQQTRGDLDGADGTSFPAARPGNSELQDLLKKMTAKAEKRVRLVDGPWAKAAVGQYATYRGQGGVAMSRKVAQADRDTVTLDVTTAIAGKEVTQQVTFPRRVGPGQGPESVPATAEWTAETLSVAGREIACRVATWRKLARDETRTFKVWLSDDVPGQLVRSGRVGADDKLSVTLELTGFGG